MANDDVLIIGKLEDDNLRKSVNELVDYIDNKTSAMANNFQASMDKMMGAMRDFAITQKVSVDLMKQAWKDMGASFDAMFEAEKRGSGGGKGSGSATYPDNTIGALEQQIALEEKKRKEMELDSQELKNQNFLIEEQNKKLKEQKSLNTWDRFQKNAKDEFGAINALSSSTIPKAQKKLQELIDLQNKYRGTKAFDEKQWNRLEAAIDNVRDKIERLKKKGATGYDTFVDIKNLMPENSIDEVAAKMKALRQVKAKDATETKLLSDEYQRLKRRQHELMGSSVQLTKSNNYLAQSFGYIRNRIVYALTLGAISNFIKQVYEIRGQYELLERSLGVLLNSFERGTQVFKELNQMAIESPFTLMELAGGAKQLSAYNFEAKEVVDTTRRLADISAALGVPMERLVYNLGQIRAQTRLTARDARDFANAGLPIVSALAERFSNLEGKIVTTGDVYDRMTKKMVSYNDVMAVINGMTDEGGKFFEFQAKQAETLRVQMANLTLATNNFLNEFGERNQGIISFFPKTLKAMLQEWRSINRVIKNVILSYGLLKLAQIVVLKGMTSMTWGMAATIATGNALTATITRLATAMKSLFLNPWTGAFVAILAIIDLIGKIRANIQDIAELNDGISESASEAAENMNKFLSNKGTIATRQLAQENKLTAEQGEKAWEQLREQIEQSAMSSSNLIGKLLEIEDINERVRVGFDYAESINKAAYALSQLDKYDIWITEDQGWFGTFGEGMVSDLKDYADELKSFTGDYQEFLKIVNTSYGDNNPLKIDYKEFQNELKVTAEDIKNFLDVHKITDPLQINEILERVRAKIKEKNPEIKGEAARLFDLELDKQMAELTNGAVDENASLWAMFMERLKHQSSAAFQGITDDWVKNSDKLSKEQQAAVDENLEYFKKSMPYAYDAVAKMVADASKLKIQIGVAFNVQPLSDFQKQVKDRIKNGGLLDFGNESMWGTSNDNLSTWVDARQKAIKALKEENKLYAKDESQWAKDKIADNNREIQQNKNLLDLFHQSYEAEKKSKGGSKKKDVLGDALKKEVELIDNIQKRYKEYEKMGVDAQTAITKATDEYGATLKSVGATLGKYGIKTISGEELAGMNIRDVRDYLQTLLNYARALRNEKGVEAIEKSIAKLNVEITKTDYKKITDGLNNELSKLKNDYELAIELDANPEIGDAFAAIIGLDMDSLPHTVSEYARRATEYLNEYLSKNKTGIKFASIELTNQQLDDLKAMVDTNELNAEVYERIKKAVEEVRKARKKEIEEHIKEWDKLIEKYSEYETKIKNIQNVTAKERKELIRTFGNESQQAKAVQLETQIRAENDPAAKQALIEQLGDLANQVSQGNPVAVKLNAAIDNKGREELAKASFEEFQKTPEWLLATGDLAYMTRDAIGYLIDKINDYKKTAKYLDPKQIKQMNNALKNLYKEQRKNNPFEVLIQAIDQAKENAALFDDKIDETKDKIKETEEEIAKAEKYGYDTTQLQAQLNDLKEALDTLEKAKKSIGSIDPETLVEGFNGAIAVAQKVTGAFTDMMNALGGKNGSGDAAAIGQMFNILEKAGSYAAMGAAIGGGYGAIIGGVLGAVSSVVTMFADEWSGNADITWAVKQSERAVKRLELAYIDLKHAMDEAYGSAEIGAQRAIITNKELQLVELKRQLQLEESRKAKNRDRDRILELKQQIKELEYDIVDSVNEITNSLLGITSVGDAAETLVTNMIAAFKKGEQFMDEYKQSFDDMIDNMIMKAIVSNVIGQRLQEMFDRIQQTAEERASAERQAYEKAAEDYAWWNKTAESGWFSEYYYFDPKTFNVDKTKKITKEEQDKLWQERLEFLKKQYEAAMTPTPEDVESIRDDMSNWRESVKEEFLAYMDAFGIKSGQDATKTLSALQQGIQGVTEDTAGAIEAYMNGISQQIYLQSDLLAEIRDAVVAMDSEFQMSTLGEILLQLRSSYEMQMAIHAMMEGWTTPSGNGIRVELLS